MKIPRHKRILSDLFIYWYAANMTNSVKKIQFIECLWIKCICGNIDKDSIFSNTNQNIYRDIPTAEKLDLHFHDFTPIIATICDPTDKKTAWRILSYTQIKLRTLQEHFIMDKVPISLPLYWSKEYSAISVSKILCKLDRMALPPFALADSSAALFNLVVRVFEDTLHIKFGNPTDVKCRVLECKKDRTKFTEALLYSLNKDDEWFLPDRYSGMQFCILKIPTLTKQTKLNSLQFGL